MATAISPEPSILITGFGPFLNILHNPSHHITTHLPPTIAAHRIIVPSTPLPAAYHALQLALTQLLERHRPTLIPHLGLALDRRHYAIERGADRDGYHAVPDEARRVFTRVEAKRCWGRSPPRLESGIDVGDVLAGWRAEMGMGMGMSGAKDIPRGREKEKQGKETQKKSKSKQQDPQPTDEDGPDLRVSDDVGNYVCGFAYYTSLEWWWRMYGPAAERRVLFLHVPWLEGEEGWQEGAAVTVALVKSVIRSCGL